MSDDEISIPLPRGWTRQIRAGLAHAVSLARLVILKVISELEHSPDPRVRLAAALERSNQKVRWLEEEIRIKDARIAQTPAPNRPRYTAELRWDIVMLRASAGWSIAETARRFMISRSTIAEWMKRVERTGDDSLLRLPAPVNRFPDFVTVLVKTLKSVNPLLGKDQIARFLGGVGLTLSASTVGRLLTQRVKPIPGKPSFVKKSDLAKGEPSTVRSEETPRVVTAKRPHHVWHVDLTVVGAIGLWVPWIPFSLPIVWPCAWWVGVVVDHFSRAVVGYAVFDREPTSHEVCELLLERAVKEAGQGQKHMISDKGAQFWGAAPYEAWCKRRGVAPRYGAIGKHGSIAVVERFILTMKREWLWRILVPLRKRRLEEGLASFVAWYNEHRPHATLGGATPRDRLTRRRRRVRPIEVRPGYPILEHGPKHRRPHRIEGALELSVSYLDGHTELPIIALRKAV